ncbi:MAG: hypothetical protein IJF14_00925 [Clostridia bacterium]|nr:hypothetical protein [Clostridia bacterium]
MIIDFHAHIQPGADHGCKNLDMSHNQLLLASQSEVEVVVSVSHFYPLKEELESYLQRQTKAKAELLSLCESNPKLPKVMIGTEVTLCSGLDKMDGLERLCIEGTNCILIEMPFTKWDNKLIETLDSIKYELDLNPILAHVDRYDPKEIEALFSLDIPGQINFYSLLPLFGRKRLLNWINGGHISAIGSDIHDLEPGYKGFDKALKIIGKENISAIMEKSGRLLNL